jgi:hypothetical protein
MPNAFLLRSLETQEYPRSTTAASMVFSELSQPRVSKFLTSVGQVPGWNPSIEVDTGTGIKGLTTRLVYGARQ